MKALILGRTGGIGSAFSARLAGSGWDVTGLSRSDGFDLTDQASVARAAERLGEARFDLILNATGALTVGDGGPEKTIRAVEASAMAAMFALNATGVALALRYFSPLLAHRREGGRAVFASLSARVGSIGDNRLGGWIAYRAAKAAQNQIIRTAAIEIARQHRGAIVVALHPGTVATRLSARYQPRHRVLTPDQSAAALLEVIAGLSPKDTGTFRDWRGDTVPW